MPKSRSHLHACPPSTTFTFDIVVGADGAWSCVCPLLSPVQPTYTGVMFVDTQLALGDANGGGNDGTERPESVELVEAATLVGHGSLFADNT
jgi:hypothetical protein